MSSGSYSDALTVRGHNPFPPPLCRVASVTQPPPGVSPIGSSISVWFRARDFYANKISQEWGDDAFNAWTFNSIDNITVANVYDEQNGSYSVTSASLGVSGTTFLFVERDGLGVPGSPFEVPCTTSTTRQHFSTRLSGPVGSCLIVSVTMTMDRRECFRPLLLTATQNILERVVYLPWRVLRVFTNRCPFQL